MKDDNLNVENIRDKILDFLKYLYIKDLIVEKRYNKFLQKEISLK